MTIKSKVFGVLAAAGLSLSMLAGVAAQPTGYVGGEVMLAEGACGIVATSGEADFGTWTWNGSEYLPGEQNTFVWLTVKTPWSSGGDSTCDLQVWTEGLQLNRHGPMQVIPADHFRTDVGQSDGSGGWVGGFMKTLPSTHTVKNGDARMQIDLRTVPSNYEPGRHTGTFNFTISDGQ